MKRTFLSALGRGKSQGEDDDEEKGGELGFLPERTCAICYSDQNPTGGSEAEMLAASATSGVIGSAQTDVTNPYETIPCGCVYCFVCLAQRIEAEEGEGWTCLRCAEIVKECKPWSGDVIDETSSRPNSNGKSVGFADDHSRDEGQQQNVDFGKQTTLREVAPVPEEDEEEKLLEETIEDLADSSAAKELDESGEWARASAMVEEPTPSASVADTEDEEVDASSEEYDDEESGYGWEEHGPGGE